MAMKTLHPGQYYGSLLSFVTLQQIKILETRLGYPIQDGPATQSARDKPEETRAVDERDEDVGPCCKRWTWQFTGKGDKPLQAEWSQ